MKLYKRPTFKVYLKQKRKYILSRNKTNSFNTNVKVESSENQY